MSKYVNAADAAEKIAEKHGIRIADLCDTFGDIPAADVVPVVHGELTEHIHELLRAEQDGRLVVLPCKIGATVYRFQRYFNDATLKSEIKIKPCVVESVSTKCIITTDHMVMLFSNFGKTVFLTREEAEKALEGNNGQKR